MPLDLPTPAHQRLVDDLLGWDDPRPVGDPALRDELRTTLEEGLAPLVDQIPARDRLFLGKSSLDALVCDGRYLDQQDTPFTWSRPMVAGKLAHRAIELDQATGRDFGPDQIAARAWDEAVTAQDGLADWLNGLDAMDAEAMRHTTEQRITDFRDTWPLLPSGAHLRLEQRMDATFLEGRVLLRGTPDLTLGGVRDDRCRMLLVDLKTGQRQPMRERQDLRFYALLATLKYGLPPFRWATYYVSEGAWDVEDLDPDLLRGAARRVIDLAGRATTLLFHRPEESELRLVGGGYCTFCGRRPTCPAVPDDPYGERAAWPD